MAFPWLLSEGFENNTIGDFNSETDTDSKLNIRHFRVLNSLTGINETVYKGAYAMHIDLSGGTADAYVEDTTGFVAAASAVLGIRFYLLASGLVMATNDLFSILKVQSAGPVDEVDVVIRNSAGTIQLGMFDSDVTGTVRATTLTQNVWHAVELVITVDSGAPNDGIAQLFVDGGQVGANITAMNNAAMSQGRLGSIGIDAGTTAGHLLFDEVVTDDARVNPLPERFPAINDWASHDQHIAVGRGRARISATDTAGALSANIYDTDNANTGVTAVPIGLLRNDATLDVVETTVEYYKGCFLDFTAGTSPQATIEFLEGEVFSLGRKKSRGLGL